MTRHYFFSVARIPPNRMQACTEKLVLYLSNDLRMKNGLLRDYYLVNVLTK